MAASKDEAIAAFPRVQCCIDRTYSRLIAWAAYTTSLPMPPTDTAPDPEWVRQRILAERVPLSANSYVTSVMPYLLEDPNVTQDIRSHLNAYNDETTETNLAGEIDGALATVMPKFADAIVSNQEVANWCEKHGYPVPAGFENVLGF